MLLIVGCALIRRVDPVTAGDLLLHGQARSNRFAAMVNRSMSSGSFWASAEIRSREQFVMIAACRSCDGHDVSSSCSGGRGIRGSVLLVGDWL
jgi:hypothetical protein